TSPPDTPRRCPMSSLLRRHPRAGAAGAALAATAALLVAGLSGSANAGTAPDARSDGAPSAADTQRTDAAPPALLKSMERDLGIARKQAERRLANEAEAGATAGRLSLALGTDFAGAWVSGADSGTLTVATTDTRDVAAIEARGAEATGVRHPPAALRPAEARPD